MNLEQARRILGVSEEDDFVIIKRKYRRLIGQHHPDTAGDDAPESAGRAQEINAAYDLLKKSRRASLTEKGAWKGTVNESAFTDRNIYFYYSLETEQQQPYYRIARGKYLWNPDEEEFELFLVSIRHAAKELLEKAEERVFDTGYWETVPEEMKFTFQAQLFQCLAMQFIEPAATLRRIAEPEQTDGQGRDIYHLRAFLSAKEKDETFRAVKKLQAGEHLYPKMFEGSKITVMNEKKHALGYLSLEDDELYFCIIPLLKKRLAQMKMITKTVEMRRNVRTQAVKISVDLFVRLEKGAQGYVDHSLNRQITDLLDRYERTLTEGRRRV